MRIWRVEIQVGNGQADVVGRSVLHEMRDFGITEVANVRSSRLFLLETDAPQDQVKRIASELLVDPTVETYQLDVDEPAYSDDCRGDHFRVEVHLKPGVMDPVAQSTQSAIDQMGIAVQSVRTAKAFVVQGRLDDSQRSLLATRILANDCIEQVVFGSAGCSAPPHPPQYQLQVRHVPLRKLSDEQLLDLSKRYDLFLNVREMRAIQRYYRRQRREPTDVELETLAQTWSEHCVHKTFRSAIDYDGPEGTLRIDNLIKRTIMAATKKLRRKWCISVFKDNAGVIAFDENHGVCFKVETHNHPSAIEPYGGASTGIGGVIRDPLGTGLGAAPIANTDVFCFARPDYPLQELPTGVLHPRRVLKGVVSGVRDYGNRMGIPTINGAIWFDQRYLANPLVYCGNVGLMPIDKCFKQPRADDLIVVAGGRTGRDGIHGATFSSGELTDQSDQQFSHAVQIGNAITEKKLTDVILQARDHPDGCLYTAITDCGAGGLSSAVGEMGQHLGAEVELQRVPLKYEGLRYDEIWISEAQERMVFAVPHENWPKLESLFKAENVEATCIGRFTGDGQLTLRYNGTQVGRLDMKFLHGGLPKSARKAKWRPPVLAKPQIPEPADYTEALLKLLAHPNIASKEWVVRQYDHEVQGGSVIKPLVGVNNDGPGDASVIRPVLESDRAVAIGCGLNPNYGDIDPYWMAACCIDEAVRNVVAVGGDPRRCAILDNFCWGNCNDEEKLGALVRACQGCYDAAVAFKTPFISGKDSLNNEYVAQDGRRISIPNTLLISALAVVPDVNRCVTMDVKQGGNLIYLIGRSLPYLGGSHYWDLHGCRGTDVPKVDFDLALKIFIAVHRLINAGLIRSCHDCSEGGLAVALAEMAFAGGLGMDIDLSAMAADLGCERMDELLFSEAPSRFIVEVAPQHRKRFEARTRNLPAYRLGTVTGHESLIISGPNAKRLVRANLDDLKQTWLKPLQFY